MRSRYAVSLVMLVCGAHALAQEAPKKSDDGDAPIVIKVVSMSVVDAGAKKGDPEAIFGVVNLDAAPCYALAPPAGASVNVGESYAVVPATDINPVVRDAISQQEPKCSIVDVVARVAR